MIAIFEAGLLVSASLSYPGSTWAYMTAYNTAFFMFWTVRRFNFTFAPAEALGKISYTFFLGGRAAHDSVLLLFGRDALSFESFGNNINNITDALFMFTLSFVYNIIFSWVITTFAERPILTLSHKLEKRITS